MVLGVTQQIPQCAGSHVESRNVSRKVRVSGGHGPLTRYVKLRVAHVPGIPGTFSRHRLQRKPLVNDPSMHHGTCVTHVPWYILGSLTRGGEENVSGIPGACATLNFTFRTRGPFLQHPSWYPSRILIFVFCKNSRCKLIHIWYAGL